MNTGNNFKPEILNRFILLLRNRILKAFPSYWALVPIRIESNKPKIN